MLLAQLVAERNPWWRIPGLRFAPEMARRRFQRRLLEFAHEGGRRALVVLGPRQVGKTFALRQLVDDLLEEGWPPGNLTYFDFSDDRLVAPVSPREVAETEPPSVVRDRPRMLLLDEIHRSERWQVWLKQAVDSEPGLRIIATGSVAGALREGSRESGQGRWDEIRVGGLTYGEHVELSAAIRRVSQEEMLRTNPNELERYLQLGGFPEHLLETSFDRARERLRTDIADRAIARDLAEFGVDVEGVRRLFAYLASESGAIFSARERARDLSVDERSAKAWVERLVDAQLVARLPQHGRGAQKLRSKPKLYAADHGLVSAFSISPEPRKDPEVFGRMVETMVFRHVRDAFDASAETLSYFRNAAGLEADFVISSGREAVVLEVTSSRAVKPDKLKRLREVGEVLGTRALFATHLGFGSQDVAGVKVVPLENLLLRPGSLGGSNV